MPCWGWTHQGTLNYSSFWHQPCQVLFWSARYSTDQQLVAVTCARMWQDANERREENCDWHERWVSAPELWMSSKQSEHQICTQRRLGTSRSSSFSDSFGSVQRESSWIWARFPFYGVCYTSVSPIIHYITRDKCIYIKTSSSSSVILRLD